MIYQELYSIHSYNQQIVLRCYVDNTYKAFMQTFNGDNLINESPMLLDYEFFKNLTYHFGREFVNGSWINYDFLTKRVF